jgi:chromate transport protein ChrA
MSTTFKSVKVIWKFSLENIGALALSIFDGYMLRNKASLEKLHVMMVSSLVILPDVALIGALIAIYGEVRDRSIADQYTDFLVIASLCVIGVWLMRVFKQWQKAIKE